MQPGQPHVAVLDLQHPHLVLPINHNGVPVGRLDGHVARDDERREERVRAVRQPDGARVGLVEGALKGGDVEGVDAWEGAGGLGWECR